MEKQLRKLGTDFAKAELSDRHEELDRRDTALLDSILSAACENGFFSFLLPESAGGSGLAATDQNFLIEEIAKESGSVASVLAAHTLGVAPMLLNRDSLRVISLMAGITEAESAGKTAVFTLAAGEDRCGFDDPESWKTSARFERGGCTLSGRKTNVLCAEVARRIVTAARRTDGSGFAIVAVPTDIEGMTIKEPRARMGLGLCPVNNVVMEEVRVPEENVIEEVVAPDRIRDYYHFAGPAIGAVATGMAQRAYAIAMKYSTERYQGGKIICEHDAIRLLLANMKFALSAAGSMIRDPFAGMPAAAFAVEAAERICLDAIQVLGGYGYMKDFAIERILRDAKTLKSLFEPAAWKLDCIKEEILKSR